MFIPVGDAPNPKGVPFVNYTLIALNVAAFDLFSNGSTSTGAGATGGTGGGTGGTATGGTGTGGSGNTEKGSLVTYSGGARG